MNSKIYIKMKKNIFFLLLILNGVLYSQNLKPNSITLSNPPKANDFSFFKEELKDVQVVLLGENSHFDGNIFETKTEIIKYLVENMGYNTIAFESGIYDLWKAQSEINTGTNCKQVFRNSLFSIWGKRNEFQSFVSFFETNKSKLKLFGFDHQITGVNGNVNLVNDLFLYSKQINHSLKLNKEDFDLLLESITNSSMFDESDIPYETFTSELNRLKKKISLQKSSEEKFYWTQIVNGLITLGQDAFFRQNIESTFYCSKNDNIRDKQMAENLLTYVKQNPEAKIICWGANQHFANIMQSLNQDIIKDFIPMGSYVKSSLKEKMYSLAIVTAKDSVFLQNQWYKTPIKNDSFESNLKKQFANDYVYFSSKNTEIDKIKENRLFSPVTFVEGKLSDFYDGYLYFPKTTLSTNDTNEDDVIGDNLIKEKEEKVNVEIISNEISKNEPNEKYIEEVVICSKSTPYQIVKKAINNLEKNYPDKAFSSDLNANILIKVSDTICVNADVMAQQYDPGYVNHINRSIKKVKETKWKVNQNFRTLSFKEYHGIMYNNPIQYAPVLKNNKFKKFILQIEGTIKIDDEEVYIIQFSSPRKHSTFTRRVFLSNYSGYLYIKKSDYAIVKMIENWEVTEFPLAFRDGFILKNDLAKYTNKEYSNEATITEFVKWNDLYFIENVTNSVTGNLYNLANEKASFDITTSVQWKNFNITNPNTIKSNSEELLFTTE